MNSTEPRKTTVLDYSASKPPSSIDPRIRGYLVAWMIAIVLITIFSLFAWGISQSFAWNIGG